MGKYDPQPLGEILKSFRKKEIPKLKKIAVVVDVWEEIVGSELSNLSRPVSVAGYVLVVEVDSPVVMQELTAIPEEAIRKRLREHKDLNFKKIKYRLTQEE